MIVGPIDSQGRFSGGINKILLALQNEEKVFENNDYEFIFHNTCLISRSNKKVGNFSLENFKNAFKLFKSLKTELKENEYNAVYWHTSNKFALIKDLIIIKLLKKRNLKMLLHIHYSDINKIMFDSKLLNAFIINLFKTTINRFILMSDNVINDFVNFGIDKNKMCCINNFYYFNKDTSINLNTNITKFMFIGSLDKRKGILDLISAFSLLDYNENVFFEICGDFTDDIIKKKCYEIIENSNIQKQIVFNGYINNDEKYDKYKECDCLILASYEEGLPLVILEAISMGLDIISTPVGSIPEVLKEYENCLYFNPGDISGLLENMSIVIKNKKDSKIRSINNYKLSNKYNFNQFSTKLIECLDIITK